MIHSADITGWKVLVADNEDGFRRKLASMLQKEYTVWACCEGQETSRQLRQFEPDALILNLLLPGKDGLALILEARQVNPKMAILVLCEFSSSYVLRKLSDMDVGYIMAKPCDVDSIAAWVKDVRKNITANRVTPADPRVLTANMLSDLEISPKRRGYLCLREAVLLMAGNPSQFITKELYPEVGLRCHASREQVERAIRTAIEAAWDGRNKEVWEQYFPRLSVRPTNAAFICCLAGKIHEHKLEQERQQETMQSE